MLHQISHERTSCAEKCIFRLIFSCIFRKKVMGISDFAKKKYSFYGSLLNTQSKLFEDA